MYKMTEEELRKSNEKIRRDRKRYQLYCSIMDVVRPIICTPLAIVFRVISLVARLISCISSLGLFLGVYYAYQSFSAFKSGIPLGEINTIKFAIVYLIFPFIAFAVTAILEKITEYFTINSY